MDLTPITTPLIEFAGAVIALAIPLLINRAVSVLHSKYQLDLTAQQQATLTAAETTAIGMIQLEMARGNTKLSDITITSTVVQKALLYLDATVPEALRFFDFNSHTMAQKLVGKLGAALAADPTVPTVAPVVVVPVVVPVA